MLGTLVPSLLLLHSVGLLVDGSKLYHPLLYIRMDNGTKKKVNGMCVLSLRMDSQKLILDS